MIFSTVQSSALPFGTTSLMQLFFQGVKPNTPMSSAPDPFTAGEKTRFTIIQQPKTL